MKKKILCLIGLTAVVLAMLCLMTSALAEGSGYSSYDVSDFEAWYTEQKESAESADHILGPDDVDTIQAYNMTIILPGETVAIVPDAGYSADAIQGGIGFFGFSIIQLNDPVVSTDYLYDGHSPEKTTFTELEKKTLLFPYGPYEVEGTSEVEYVSLYRNDTGYPVVVRGHHGASRRNIYSETSEDIGGRAYVGYTTYRQARGALYYAPYFFFVEPTYKLTLRTATGSGTPYEWPVENPLTALTVYMDHSDHTYELDNPSVPGCRFKNWLRIPDTFAFPIDRDGVIDGKKTTYTFNMQACMREGSDMDPVKFACDAELAAEWYTGSYTVRFHAGEGTINSLKTLLVEAEFNFEMDDYKAIWSGHTFQGWCTDESNPTGTILEDATSDNLSGWFPGGAGNLDVYAVWDTKYTISFDANGGTGSMANVTVDAGTRYTLPANGFTAPEGKEFDTWDAGAVGSQIEVSEDIVIKAIWKDLPTPTPSSEPDPTPTEEPVSSSEVTPTFTPEPASTNDPIPTATPNQSETVIYTCIEGNGSSWEKESSSALRFVFKRNINDETTFAHFTKIQVDGKDVAESNYTKASGSVIITLKQTYLETLSTGTHTLTAYFDDSNRAADANASFTIRGKSDNYVVPKTGDEEPLLLWTLISLVGLCLILGGLFAKKRGQFHK